MPKNSKSFVVLPRSLDINGAVSNTQSIDSNITFSTDSSLNIAHPPIQTVNANMPQPPPSISRALMSLNAPSYTNKNVNFINESENDSTENQQRLISLNASNAENAIIAELNDENDVPVDEPPLKRQSARIQKSKRTYTAPAVDSPARKKKKKKKKKKK
jgi:hypothetical protein